MKLHSLKRKLMKFHSKMDFNSKGRISRFFHVPGNLYFYSKLVALKLHTKKIRISNFWLRLSYSLKRFFSWSHLEGNYESSKIKTKFVDWLLRKNCQKVFATVSILFWPTLCFNSQSFVDHPMEEKETQNQVACIAIF